MSSWPPRYVITKGLDRHGVRGDLLYDLMSKGSRWGLDDVVSSDPNLGSLDLKFKWKGPLRLREPDCTRVPVRQILFKWTLVGSPYLLHPFSPLCSSLRSVYLVSLPVSGLRAPPVQFIWTDFRFHTCWRYSGFLKVYRTLLSLPFTLESKQ